MTTFPPSPAIDTLPLPFAESSAKVGAGFPISGWVASLAPWASGDVPPQPAAAAARQAAKATGRTARNFDSSLMGIQLLLEGERLSDLPARLEPVLFRSSRGERGSEGFFQGANADKLETFRRARLGDAGRHDRSSETHRRGFGEPGLGASDAAHFSC